MPIGHHTGREDYMSRRIDQARVDSNNEFEQRRLAENALMELISATMTGVEIKQADKTEDAGIVFTAQHSQIKGNKTDLIMFRGGLPFLSIQVTTGMSEKNRDNI